MTATEQAQTVGLGDCPNGYEWSRRKAWCVQSSCSKVTHAHLAHGGECVCSTAGGKAQKQTDPIDACRHPPSYAPCPKCVYACVVPGTPCPTAGGKPKPKPKPEPSETGRPGAKPPSGSACPDQNATRDNDGNCWCGNGFDPTPVDGKCISNAAPPPAPPRCGDGVCNWRRSRGDDQEDCSTCSQDCFCQPDEFCVPPAGAVTTHRCVERKAELLEWGCRHGTGTPTVTVTRNGEALALAPGMALMFGDRLRIRHPGGNVCKDPYMSLDWGGAIGRVVLGPATFEQEVKIQRDAIETGWPRDRSGDAQSATWWVVRQVGEPPDPRSAVTVRPRSIPQLMTDHGSRWAFSLDSYRQITGARLARRAGALARAGIAPVVDFLMSPATMAGPDVTHVWVKSTIMIEQHRDGTLSVMTLQGAPEVAYNGATPQTVAAGTGLRVDGDGTLTALASIDVAAVAARADGPVFCEPGTHRSSDGCVPDDEARSAKGRPGTGSRLVDLVGWVGIGLAGVSGLLLLVALVRR